MGGTRTRIIIRAPGGRLRECDQVLAEHFGFRKRRLLERQWKYHFRLTKEIKRMLMEKYPDLGGFSILYFEDQPLVQISAERHR